MKEHFVRGLITLAVLLLQGCNSPFQVKQEYSPQLVVYGIAFSGDSSLVIRVERNTRTSPNDTSVSPSLSGLNGTLLNGTTGNSETLIPVYIDNMNRLLGKMNVRPGTKYILRVGAEGYPDCSSNLTVLDSGIIYPAYFTNSVLRNPSGGDQDPQFAIYSSPLTMAIRLTLSLKYQGTGPDGKPVDGEISINPSYQQDTTSYFLRTNGATTNIHFRLSDYSGAFSSAIGSIKSGSVTAVVKLLQIDATLYDFYSITNGFNDPLTMRTEKPVYTNIANGLGFFGSARYDSLSIQVYP